MSFSPIIINDAGAQASFQTPSLWRDDHVADIKARFITTYLQVSKYLIYNHLSVWKSASLSPRLSPFQPLSNQASSPPLLSILHQSTASSLREGPVLYVAPPAPH